MNEAKTWWGEIVINNYNFIRDILRAVIDFISSGLKVFVDAWLEDYVKQ